MHVQTFIEGDDAAAAVDDLAAIPGLRVTMVAQADEEPTKDPATAVLLALSVIGAAANVATIADLVLAWRRRQTDRGKPGVHRVLIIGRDGQRFLLDELTAGQLASLFAESVQQEPSDRSSEPQPR